MNGSNRELRKQTSEEDCAERFLGWYNGRYGTRYQLVRAEEAFPKLAGRTRWEFVARQSEKDTEWLAIEVKGLRIREAHRLIEEWSKLLKQVSRDLDGRLKGSFAVIGSPSRVLKHQQWTELKRAMVQSILDVAPKMSTREEVDLRPEILRQCLHWSFDTVLEMEPGRHFIGRAHALRLRKTSDNGCSVHMRWRAPRSSDEEEVKKAISLILSPVGRRTSKGNRQLRVAKEMGAEKTILVLDSHVSWPVDTIKQAVANIGASLLSNVDGVYLVPPYGQVNEIWQRKSPES